MNSLNLSSRHRRYGRTRAAIGVAAGLALVISACGGSDSGSGDGELYELTYPILGGGGLGSVPGWYAAQSGLDEEYGFDLSFADYSSPQSFYAALATGESMLSYGPPDGLAPQAAAGSQLRIIATFSHMSGVLIAQEDFEWTDPTSLAGNRLTTLEASGTYEVMKSFINDQYDITIRDDVDVVNASSLPEGPTQVAAGTADVAMSWEPAASTGLVSNPDLKVVYRLGDDYREKLGEDLWHFTLVINDEASDLSEEQVDNFVAMMAESTQYLADNPDEADRVAVDNGLPDGAFEAAINSGQLPYVVEPITDEIAQKMQDQLARSGADQGLSGEIPDSFWGNE